MITRWLRARLEETRGKRLVPPGGSQNFGAVEASGAVLTIAARTDVFEVYQGKTAIYTFALSDTTMLKLARWVLWTWWIRGTWCGLKPRLWAWVARRTELGRG